MKVYFDNAATTPLHPEVIEAMLPYMKDHFGNPSSIHSYGRETRAAIEKARKTIAHLLYTSPSEIFFTSGGTEANNMAIRCTLHNHKIKHAITSPIEHHAVLHTLEELEKNKTITLHWVDTDDKGRINLPHLEHLLAAYPGSFVSLMHANNEIGTLLPLGEAASLCQMHNAVLHSDTVQTMGHFEIDLSKTPVDFINGAAHKFHGPKGAGFIYIRNRMKILPLITGGSQERNMRGGTENLYGIIGMAKALEISCREMENDKNYISGLKNYMMEKIKSEIPDVSFNGDVSGQSLYTVLNVSFPPSDSGEMLLFNLDIAGIAASGGSACSSGSEIGSHVLKAIHASADRPAVRFSFSKFNKKEEIDYCVEKLKELFLVKA
jgi:cysteine desulfurase